MIQDASAIYPRLTASSTSSLQDETTLDLAFYEIGNTLLKELRLGYISAAAFAAGLDGLAAMGSSMKLLAFSDLDPALVAKVAEETGLTFYDSAYLTASVMTGETLVTNDARLAKAARKLGVVSSGS